MTPSTNKSAASSGEQTTDRELLELAAVLIRRASGQLREWNEKYGEHQPQWLPPAGDVRWQEDASDYLAAMQQQEQAHVG